MVENSFSKFNLFEDIFKWKQRKQRVKQNPQTISTLSNAHIITCHRQSAMHLATYYSQSYLAGRKNIIQYHSCTSRCSSFSPTCYESSNRQLLASSLAHRISCSCQPSISWKAPAPSGLRWLYSFAISSSPDTKATSASESSPKVTKFIDSAWIWAAGYQMAVFSSWSSSDSPASYSATVLSFQYRFARYHTSQTSHPLNYHKSTYLKTILLGHHRPEDATLLWLGLHTIRLIIAWPNLVLPLDIQLPLGFRAKAAELHLQYFADLFEIGVVVARSRQLITLGSETSLDLWAERGILLIAALMGLQIDLVEGDFAVFLVTVGLEPLNGRAERFNLVLFSFVLWLRLDLVEPWGWTLMLEALLSTQLHDFGWLGVEDDCVEVGLDRFGCEARAQLFLFAVHGEGKVVFVWADFCVAAHFETVYFVTSPNTF